MATNNDIPKLDKKVYFLRHSEPIYKAVAALADRENRSINNMGEVLMTFALNNYPNPQN